MTEEAALFQFWSGFLTAYEENSVPEDATYPYLTYQIVIGNFGEDTPMAVSLWYRGTSWLEANAKTREIKRYIGKGGKFIDCDNGKIWIKLGDPIAQNMGDESDNLIKRKYLNVTAEFLTAD